MGDKPTTGKISYKKYRCPRCGRIEGHSTNHWGEFYDRCNGCSWKNPMDPTVAWECLEECPEGFDKPEPWKKVKLKDIMDIQRGVDIKKGSKLISDMVKIANKLDKEGMYVEAGELDGVVEKIAQISKPTSIKGQFYMSTPESLDRIIFVTDEIDPTKKIVERDIIERDGNFYVREEGELCPVSKKAPYLSVNMMRDI